MQLQEADSDYSPIFSELRCKLIRSSKTLKIVVKNCSDDYSGSNFRTAWFEIQFRTYRYLLLMSRSNLSSNVTRSM